MGDTCDTTDNEDGDLFLDGDDNCPSVANDDQSDADGDGLGDACNDAFDADADEWQDTNDNCPEASNAGQDDTDGDGVGDACNDADDADGDEYGSAADCNNADAGSTVVATDTDCDGVLNENDKAPRWPTPTSWTQTAMASGTCARPTRTWTA